MDRRGVDRGGGPYRADLIWAAINRDRYAKYYGLRCDGCDADSCDARAGVYFGREWTTCPLHAVATDRRLTAVLTIRRMASLSPLAGWPSGYSAWVPQIWAEVEDAIEERRHG